MVKILFICDGNVARSQEAEIFLNDLSEGKHTAMSAGVNPKIGKPIDPLVIQVMKEVGYSMDESVRKPIDESSVANADVVVSFKPAHELPDFVRHHGNVQYWDVADPARQSVAFHRHIRDLVKSKVESLLASI